ncbi:hypothetical protein BX666DRAFT_1896748 [Dichotomocladium elegans]|nr:hypothetical protein BX666DRAFT_1896748 [Dichotomocladium elegans]
MASLVPGGLLAPQTATTNNSADTTSLSPTNTVPPTSNTATTTPSPPTDNNENQPPSQQPDNNNDASSTTSVPVSPPSPNQPPVSSTGIPTNGNNSPPNSPATTATVGTPTPASRSPASPTTAPDENGNGSRPVATQPQDGNNNGAGDRPNWRHRTIVTSSASAVVSLSTKSNGQVFTYTLTSYVPYTTTISEDDSGDPQGNSSTSTASLAGGIAGGVIAAALIGIIAFCALRKRRRGHQQLASRPPTDNSLGYHDSHGATGNGSKATTPVMAEATPRPLVAPAVTATMPPQQFYDPGQQHPYQHQEPYRAGHHYDIYPPPHQQDRHVPDQVDYEYHSQHVAVDVPHTRD